MPARESRGRSRAASTAVSTPERYHRRGRHDRRAAWRPASEDGDPALGRRGGVERRPGALMTERVEERPDPAAAAKTFDVVVVGGGLSGLGGARGVLRTPGQTVGGLGASHRVGGRLLDAHFGATGVAELGGEWVAPDQKHVTALIAELGLATTPTFTTGCTTLN